MRIPVYSHTKAQRHKEDALCVFASLREKFPLSRPIAQALAWTFASVCLLLAGCSRTGAGERGGGAAAAHDSQPGAEAASPSDSLVIGRLGRQPGLFTKPRAVGFLAGGDMIVIDRSGRIQRLDPQGAHRLDWRLPAFENGTPTGFSVDPRDDSLWVADTHYMRILHYSPDGRLLGQFGRRGAEAGEMLFPTSISLDPDGATLWVSEYGQRNRIIHFAQDGTFLGEWGKIAEGPDDMLRPQSLVAMPGGPLFVADAGHHRIWRFKRGPGAPEPIGAWGREGTAPGELKYPYDLALGPDQTLFVLEYGNSRISHFTMDGRFLGCWGAPGGGPDQLQSPWGIAFDPPRGRLLVADTNNNRLLLLPSLPVQFLGAARQTAARKP